MVCCLIDGASAAIIWTGEPVEDSGSVPRFSTELVLPARQAHLGDLVADLAVIPAQTTRDFLYREPAHKHFPSLFSSPSDHSLLVFPVGGSSSALVPCGSRIEAPIRRSSASCSGFRGPLRNAPTSISVT